MGYTNGSSGDSHSAQGTRQRGDKGPPGIGFSLTADEHYHIKNKRLTNVSAPIDNSDATTKKFVHFHLFPFIFPSTTQKMSKKIIITQYTINL